MDDDPASVRIASFDVSPRSVPVAGDEVEVKWLTQSATGIAIFANDEALELGGADPAGGSLLVPVFGETTFRLVAEGRGGPVESRHIEVKIEPVEPGAPGVFSFEASPSEIELGETATLSWVTYDAESIRIVDGSGSVLDLGDAGVKEGSVQVQPETTTSYTLYASAGDREAEAHTSVAVQLPPPLQIVSFEPAAPGAQAVGEPVTLNWVVEQAERLELSNGEGETVEVIGAETAAGSRTLTMGAAGVFELTAFRGDESVEASVTVPILRAPEIGRFMPVSTAVTAPSGTVTLQWQGVERAASLVLESTVADPIDVSSAGLEEGSFDVTVSEDTSFTLVAVNAAGEASKSTTVVVVAPAAITSFVATPPRVGATETFTLSWTTADATSIQVTTAAGPLDDIRDFDLDHSVQLQITEDTEYTLRALNEAGDFAEERLTVTVGAPEILSFTATPHLAPGQTIDFSWEVLGGTSLALVDEAGGTICSTSAFEDIASGSCTAVAPLTDGAYAFELRVENGLAQTSTESVSVVVSDGPFIGSFVANPTQVSEGGQVTFTWNVYSDPLGVPHTLTLTDGTANYDISDADLNQGSKAFPMPDAGDLTFTLTAESVNGTSVASAGVEVVGAPAVTLTASHTEYDGTTPITLSWTSENADLALSLYTLDDAGGLVLPPIYTALETERAAGSYDVTPSTQTTYRVMATNSIGDAATADQLITLAPPQILTFEANPPEVVAGDDVTLSWTTALADEVELSIPGGTLILEERTDDPFVDISSTGTLLPMTSVCGFDWANFVLYPPEDEGCAFIEFPAGFSFPFDGEMETAVQVYANGVMGFDFSFDGYTYYNEAFPGQYFPAAQIAPFWDDQHLGAVHYEWENGAFGQRLIVQWTSDLGDINGNVLGASLQYQAVLHEDGAITFRYGQMTGPGVVQDYANGASATIGYQMLTTARAAMLHFGGESFNIGDPVSGGLSNRTWSFLNKLAVPLSGSHVVQPTAGFTATLTAFGEGEVSEEVTIIVHERATVIGAAPTQEAQAGADFALSWSATDAHTIEVLDDGGAVLCTITDPAEVESGSCTLNETAAGIYTYTVRATGALGHQVEDEVDVQVFAPFDLLSFEAPQGVDAGQDATLSWEALGAASATLTADGIDIFPAGASPDLGSTTHTITAETTFVFTITAADGRTRSASRTVDVRTLDLTVQASASSVSAGTQVNIDWTATQLAGTDAPIVSLGMFEVGGPVGSAHTYLDISSTGTLLYEGLPNSSVTEYVDLTSTELGFAFPFDGQLQNTVRVHRRGHVSFDTVISPSTTYDNTALPSSSTYGASVHLPVLWGDIEWDQATIPTGAGVYGQAFPNASGPDFYVIQWTHLAHWQRDVDLNFQLVLFEDGSFEYRYGAMTSPSGDATAEGGKKTIGYQSPSGSWWQLHYGGGWSSSSSNDPFPGGLTGRAWRYQPPTGTSMTVTPEETTTYTVCAELDGYRECQDVTVEVTNP